MIPWLRCWQLIEGFLGEDRVEVTKVQRYAFVIHWLRVLLKPSARHWETVAVFCLWKETCCPDVITFFKWFIRKVRVDRAIGILYECREWACATSVYLLCKLLFCLAFISALGSTGNAALWKAPCHLDSSSMEVNLRDTHPFKEIQL